MARIPLWLVAAVCVGACCPSASRPEAPNDAAAQPEPRDEETERMTLPLPKGAEQAAATITPEDLKKDVVAFSHDRFEGRGPGTSGDEGARRWLAEQLEAAGYAPGAEGGRWEQPFEIVGITADMPEKWVFRSGSGETRAFSWWDEFIAASGVQEPAVEVKDAEVVFVGYGIQAPEQDWDDFEGVDLEGKILLMLNDDPSWDPELFAGERRLYYGRWTYKYESAARQKAAGAIIIHTDASAGYPWKVVQTSWDGEQVELPAQGEPRAPIHGWLTEEAASQLVALSGHELDDLVKRAHSRDFSPVPLGVTTNLSFKSELRRTKTANVIGMLRGSDPELSKQAVVFTAHHDHLGKDEGAGDVIYNGARDNGAGVAQGLAVARAFSALPEPPSRSLLFVFVGAEEQGLLGSKYFAQHPTFAAANIAANINFELGNIWGKTENVVVHGKGKTSMDRHLEEAAARQNRRVEDEADPRSGWYYRSDQFSFAREGIPSMWFESGRDFVGKPAGWGDEVVDGWVSTHYHQPSDEVTDAWRFDGMAQDAELAFFLGAAVASAEEMPSWSPGDEFAGIR